MRFIKQYWYVGLLLVGTIGLGFTTLLISLRLQQKEQVTPATPQAQEAATPTPLCMLTFNLTIPTDTPIGAPTATSTPTPTITPIPSNTPTGAPTATNTPIPTATNTPAPTPTPNPQCNSYCTGPDTCNGLSCINNYCRNASCSDQVGCVCPSPTPTITPTPWPTNTPAPGACNYTCSSNGDCANNLICSNGMCRNPSCTEQPNCACYFVPTPKVPITGTGTTALGLGVIGGGIILLLLGLAF